MLKKLRLGGDVDGDAVVVVNFGFRFLQINRISREVQLVSAH